jgi:hypothetical protein
VSTVSGTATNAVAGRARRAALLLISIPLAVGAAVVAGLLVVSLALPDLFGTTTKEQPNAVVLAQLEDLAQYQAASGRFQTLVDVEQDANLVPDWVKGERTVLAAEGDVAAAVDFSGLGDGALEVSADGKTAVVHLPPPALQPARIDRSTTRVIARDRGVLDRIDDALTSGNPTADEGLYQRAEEKLSDAAAQSDLRRRAEENTNELLTKLLTEAGFENVTVVFDGARADPATTS